MTADGSVWTVILGLALVTALIRYSFLGLLRGGQVPPRIRTALGFVPATVLPALVAPMVIYAPRSEDFADPHRLVAGAVALGIGVATRNMVATVAGGLAAFLALRALGL